MSFFASMFAGGARGVIEGVGGAVSEVVRTVAGDRAEKDRALAAEDLERLRSLSAEFAGRASATWWDSFVDGLNRLVRPACTFGVVALFVWPCIDPLPFMDAMRALALVPEPLWVIAASILGFWFTGKLLERLPRRWSIDPKAIALARELAAEKARLAPPPAVPPATEPVPPAVAASPAAVESATAFVPAEAAPASVVEESFRGAVDNAGDRVRALAATIWGEARGESLEGKIAVACVVRNRVRNPGWWGNGWTEVCTAPWQFTCWHDVQAERVRWVDERNAAFVQCLKIAEDMVGGTTEDVTGGADHYYAASIPTPAWARGRTPTTRIGSHVFFRLGLAGRG